MFETYPELQKLRHVADILAGYKDWPVLYDPVQLAKNEVPIYAATFMEDMYVDYGLVQETLKKVKNHKHFSRMRCIIMLSPARRMRFLKPYLL